MRIQALAVDYDGTIAHHGVIAQSTRDALAQVRASGRRLFLVTGRMLDQLLEVYPDPADFDLIVAENGAVLYDPATAEIVLLGEEPPAGLIEELKRSRIPFNRGRIIVETVEPHEVEVLRAIKKLGIEWDLTFNKGAVMALPSGIDKASGLTAALDRFKLSVHNCAGIGDAENDHNFLRVCEVAAATGNALPAIKERADLVMRRRNGRGVIEFIEGHVLPDLKGETDVLSRYSVTLGTVPSGEPLTAPVHGANMLVLGSSGSGKSTLTGVFVERLVDDGYQVCVIDPEGEHAALDPLVMVGNPHARPTLEEVEVALERAPAGLVVNLVSMSLADKVAFSADLLSSIVAIRAAHGRPHWIIIDEAHHLLPADGSPGTYVVPEGLDGLCFITMTADLLSRHTLERVSHLYVVGADAGEQVAGFAAAAGLKGVGAAGKALSLMQGEAVTAQVREGTLSRPRRFRVAPRRTLHRRHVRKYAAGDLRQNSFFFRGPDDRLNLRAYNVTVFAEMARGVDLGTWTYHLKRGDYVTWLRECVKDPGLSEEVAELIAQGGQPEDVREEVLNLVQSRYTAGG